MIYDKNPSMGLSVCSFFLLLWMELNIGGKFGKSGVSGSINCVFLELGDANAAADLV